MAMAFSPSVSLPFFSRRLCCSSSYKCCPFISPRSNATKGIETLFALATTTRRRRKSIITIRFTGVNASLGSSAEAGRLESFWRWLCERGVVSEDSPLVKPGVVREGLGLVAQRNISQNEVVIKVPRKLWINPDTVAASQIGSVCSGLKPWISVALFLVREKAREDSPWRTYFGILPDSTNSTIFWNFLFFVKFAEVEANIMDESPESNTFFTIAVGYLIFNTVGAIVRIRQDMVAVTFTISFFVFLMILFWSVSVFQKLPQDSKKRERMKIPIWVLATALNLMFAYRIWTIVLPGMVLGWLVWGMAGTASLVTFYFFFLYGDKKTCRSGK